jgi:hypothetical protein
VLTCFLHTVVFPPSVQVVIAPAARLFRQLVLSICSTRTVQKARGSPGQWRRGVRHDTTRLDGVWSQAGKTLAIYLSIPVEWRQPIQFNRGTGSWWLVVGGRREVQPAPARFKHALNPRTVPCCCCCYYTAGLRCVCLPQGPGDDGWIVYIIRVRPARCSDPIRCAPVSDGVARGLAAEKVWWMGGGWRAITQLLRSVRQQVTTDPKS